ncbi:MAG: F0F1 ATP synthase subunit A [Holosporales bacterium]|jgi:F-type H+-transporting ATPase subunit a|nr:F0F1 ATP synthase subunit A [Holosporales bacterium]
MNPLHQFEIKPILDISAGGISFAFTNSSLAVLLSCSAFVILMLLCTSKRQLIPSRAQAFAEFAYQAISSMVDENIGQNGRHFFPFVFSLFFFILAGNMFGLIPYCFTFTSHIIATFTLAMIAFLLVTIYGFIRHGLHFLSYFVPKGVPLVCGLLLMPIELFSYLSRPISLSIRLFANMMAGHTMLKVFAGFSALMGVWGIAPLVVNVVLTGFELLVAVLQAYVFTVLTCLYLHDAVYLH